MAQHSRSKYLIKSTIDHYEQAMTMIKKIEQLYHMVHANDLAGSRNRSS